MLTAVLRLTDRYYDKAASAAYVWYFVLRTVMERKHRIRRRLLRSLGAGRRC